MFLLASLSFRQENEGQEDVQNEISALPLVIPDWAQLIPNNLQLFHARHSINKLSPTLNEKEDASDLQSFHPSLNNFGNLQLHGFLQS